MKTTTSSFCVLFLFIVSSLSEAQASSENKRFCNDWAVEITSGDEVMATRIASDNGFTNLGQIGNLKNIFHFQLIINDSCRQSSEYHFKAERPLGEFSQITEMSYVTKSLKENAKGMVGYVEQQLLLGYSTRTFNEPSDPEYENQWSLLNTGQTNGPTGLDLNVVPAWMQGITGKGVVVAVVDDGLDHENEDLYLNYDSEASWDFVNTDGDPTPEIYYNYENTTDTFQDNHGTGCAGEIGMAKSNDVCGVGVAYECNLGGLKLNFSDFTDLTSADALSHNGSYIDIYSNSWGPSDFGFTVEGPAYLTTSTLETGAQTGRNGKGNIYVWAAGNGGTYFDSCAADGYVLSIYTIPVGAADQSGNQAVYDEQCSAKMVVTFNHNSETFDSDPRFDQVVTTDVTMNGGCRDDFGGTSSAAPLVAGVIALALQANPDLTWRDVQYLLAYTSDASRLIDGDWSVNGGGLMVSHKHGFGAVDSEAVVTRAKRWINVPPQTSAKISSSPDEGTAMKSQSFSTTFNVDSSNSNSITFLEHVVVNLSLSLQGQGEIFNSTLTDNIYNIENITDFLASLSGDHPKRGDIRVELSSPQGMTSILLPYRDYDFINDEGYDSWPFMSVLHWGENPIGQWTLNVYFNTSTLVDEASVQVMVHGMTLYGTEETPPAVANIPSTCHASCARGCSGPTAADCDVCREYRLNSTLECVSSCPQGTTQQNNYCFGSIINQANVVVSTKLLYTCSFAVALALAKAMMF